MVSVCEALAKMDEASQREFFFHCCASGGWVEAMVRRSPFHHDEELHEAARQAAHDMSEQDWLEAFQGHPMIGDVSTLKERFRKTKAWASQEQAGTAEAAEEILAELAELNVKYLERFGFIFIIFATGKTAAEMLHCLKERLGHSRQAEVKAAAEEQLKITLLRLTKLPET